MGQEELAAFLKRLAIERRLSPHTTAAYGRDLRALLEFCGREQIASLTYHPNGFVNRLL